MEERQRHRETAATVRRETRCLAGWHGALAVATVVWGHVRPGRPALRRVRNQELFLRAALVWSKLKAWATSLLFHGPLSKVLHI